MRITNNLTFNRINYNFCAGITRLYTDFDGTYFPFSQDSIIYENKQNILQVNRMYSDFRKFADIAKDKFSMIITTGRSKLEMLGVLRDFEKSKVYFKEPDGYIFRDGFEERNNVSNGSLVDSSSPRFFKEKEDIKQIISETDDKITILEPLSNKRITGNDEKSLITLFRNTEPEKRKKYVSFVSDAEGIIELSFHPDIDTTVYSEKIHEYYNKNNIPVDISIYNNDRNMYVPCQKNNADQEYTFIEANVILIKHKKDSEQPVNKLYQPKQAVKEIIQNKTNDLVIVAGDSSNDIEMLNPFNYIDLLGVYPDNSKAIHKLLDDDNILSAIEKLPLVVIIAGENKSLESIRKIKNSLENKGINKIFTARYPDSDFINKIKQGMLVYSENNDNYKYNLSFELFEEIMK